MPTTTPDNQYYAADGTTMSFEAVTGMMASNAQAAFSVRQIKSWRVSSQLLQDAVTGMVNGDLLYRTDTSTRYTYNGTVWKVSGSSNWTTYSGSPSGFTVGTGGISTFEWRYEDERVRVRYNMKLGTSGFSASGNPVSIALPFTAAALPGAYMIYDGLGGALDNSSQFFPTMHLADNTSLTRARIYTINPYANILPTSPFTWATGYVLAGEFVYQPA